uniref:transcription factor UNE10-like isoform X2 n=1 Tax=Erigeron canadensis TaxID=72917 RepID=UPI001CB8D49D|nr:transcription factor UNE10-like isoform X2 [Erigeron canadensis]
MSQCVPSWDLEDNPAPNSSSSNPDQGRLKVALRAPSSNSMSSVLDVPTLDYEVAELTWKNGQVAMHGLGPPRVVSKYTWDKPRAAETLEAIVNQATCHKPQLDFYAHDLVPWIDHHSSAVVTSGRSATMTMDALVPSANTQPRALLSGTNGALTRCSTRVASCSGAQSGFGDHMVANGGATAREWSSQSVSGSETFGMESSRQLTFDTCERDLGVKGGFNSSPSMGSPGNTVSGGKHSTKSTSPDENDSVCHSRPQKQSSELEDKKKGKGKSSTTSTKRSRAAAIHNQSERKRRDKINQKMKTLQKLVPNANKTDKASMLDEVIEYLKQLQAQIHMIGRMNMSPMMMAMQQQQQLQMAAMMNHPMTMGMAGAAMGMGMPPPPGVMDLNAIGGNRPNILGMPAGFHPASAFMQPSWDMHQAGTAGDRRVTTNQNDPMAAFLACQSQPMTMDGYNRMAAMFQQMQNQPGYTGLKN